MLQTTQKCELNGFLVKLTLNATLQLEFLINQKLLDKF